MKKRSVLAVILLPIVTLGIYSIVWFVKTKKELNVSKLQKGTYLLNIEEKGKKLLYNKRNTKRM